MSKMGYIAYLAENNMRDELVEEVGSSIIADGFIEAAEQIEKNKEIAKEWNRDREEAINKEKTK